MHTITSTFQSTAIVPADAQGPYVVSAGASVTLSARFTYPDATYAWDLGDGTTANTSTVTHTYSVQGTYIAKLTVVVNEPGGAETRSFAEIQVLDVAPTVNVGPDQTVNEGDLVPFNATFTDPELSLSHVALWFWGDNQAPDDGTVTETHTSPLAQGFVTGTHAWGDSGNYTVTLLVRDTLGATGMATCNVTVLNVAPTVHAGPSLFAYPGFVITLQGRFTDPGWLDNHVGSWEFGDATGRQPAIIHEHNLPPMGRGSVIASHSYATRGTYQATCRVVDDDGAVGHHTTIISVVDVENAGFELGFVGRTAGDVANGWADYASTIAAFQNPAKGFPPNPGTYHAEAFRVHQGQRAQRIELPDASRAGLAQRVGANPGWRYQIAGFYSVLETSAGMVRLGVDPFGGMDANAPEVIWSIGRRRGKWDELAVQVHAKESFITIFVEAVGRYQPTDEELEDAAEASAAGVTKGGQSDRSDGVGVVAWFDDLALIPMQPAFYREHRPPDTSTDEMD